MIKFVEDIKIKSNKTRMKTDKETQHKLIRRVKEWQIQVTVVESILRDKAVGMNEYNELVVTVKVVTKLCSPKRERDVNVRKKPSWKQT